MLARICWIIGGGILLCYSLYVTLRFPTNSIFILYITPLFGTFTGFIALAWGLWATEKNSFKKSLISIYILFLIIFISGLAFWKLGMRRDTALWALLGAQTILSLFDGGNFRKKFHRAGEEQSDHI